jgi:heptosyltransferase II
VTPSAVIQVKRGIGDVIWHLPFIRAIAAASPGGQVTFLAPPSSGAKELLAAEPSVAETVYFEHAGSEFMRAVNLMRLVTLLRRHRFRTLWILDRTLRPALAAKLAGIPERIGLGLGPQSLLITNPGIDHGHFHDHPLDWLCALMAAMKVPLPTTEPDLRVQDGVLTTVGQKFAASRRPWIVLGIGAADPARDWPDRYWGEFIAKLRRVTSGSIYLIGGVSQYARAEGLIAESGCGAVVNTCNFTLTETLALLRHADLFVGPDSGPMNLAAAVGTPAFALFGVNRTLRYSKFIHAIEPEGGPGPGGMLRISPDQVAERVAASLVQDRGRG